MPLARNRTAYRCKYASRGKAKNSFRFSIRFWKKKEADSEGRTPAFYLRLQWVVRFGIRQFNKADFDTLWRIDQACFDPQLAYTRPELAFYIRRPGAFTLIAESVEEFGGRAAEQPVRGETNREIIGFIVAENRRKNGHIITLDVVAEARRSGVGSGLLRAAEDKLAKAGTGIVALETPVSNLTAIRFYRREGYFVEKTVAGYYSGLLDALVMTKELAHG